MSTSRAASFRRRRHAGAHLAGIAALVLAVGAGARGSAGRSTSPNRPSPASPWSAASSRPRTAPGPTARADVQVPVASLRSRGRRRLVRQDLHIDQRRNAEDLHDRLLRHRQANAVPRPGDLEGRRDAGDERRDIRGLDGERQARELVAADHLRQRDRRLPPHRAPGTWVGESPITYSYQWLRCDKAGNACGPISGRTTSQYTLVQADQGRTVRLKVVARNSRGNADAFSSATTEVQANPSDGTIDLPNGETSVEAKQVRKDQRLVVDQVVFSPNPVTSKSTRSPSASRSRTRVATSSATRRSSSARRRR